MGKAAPSVNASRFVAPLAAKPGLRKRNLPFFLSDTAASCPRDQLGDLPQPTNAGGFPGPDQKLLLWEEASPAVPGDEE